MCIYIIYREREIEREREIMAPREGKATRTRAQNGSPSFSVRTCVLTYEAVACMACVISYARLRVSANGML